MIENKQVEKAVDALLLLLKKKDERLNITDQPEKIDVQFTLKQIPKVKHKNIPLSLPHSIHTDMREVCLFVKDVIGLKDREYEKTVQHYEDILKKHNIDSISKIVPIKALRTDYSMFSSKRSLAKAYDLYLADETVKGLLPGLLGKIFYAKKKLIPVQVNMSAQNLKSEIDRAVNNTRCVLQGSGSNCCVMVAHNGQTRSEIVDNIVAACNQLATLLPGGSVNIKNIYIKGSDTTALPLYFDFSGGDGVELKEAVVRKVPTFTDEITTVEGAKVMIRADGMVKVIKDKAAVKEEGEDDSSNEEDSEGEDEDREVVEEPADEDSNEGSDSDNGSNDADSDSNNEDESVEETTKAKKIVSKGQVKSQQSKPVKTGKKGSKEQGQRKRAIVSGDAVQKKKMRQENSSPVRAKPAVKGNKKRGRKA